MQVPNKYRLPKNGLPDLTQIPKPGDSKLGEFCFDLFLCAKFEKERQSIPDKWEKNHRLWRGAHWRDGVRQEKGLLTANKINTFVKRRVAHLTDNHPKADIINVNEDPQAESMASTANQAYTGWHLKYKIQKILRRVGINQQVYGPGVAKVPFDPDLDSGKGDARAFAIDPFHLLVPEGYKDIEDMPFLIHAYPMSMADVIRLWPKSKNKIKPDSWIPDWLAEDRDEVYGGTVIKTSPFGGHPDPGTDYEYGAGQPRKGNRVLVMELWIKDYSTKKITVDMPVGQDMFTGEMITEPIEHEVYVYPDNIRCITTCNSGEVVLADRKNPNINWDLPYEQTSRTFLWGKFPFAMAAANEDPARFWPFSTIEVLDEVAREIDKKITQVSTFYDRVIRPPLILPDDQGVPTSAVKNINGLILRPKRGPGSQYIRMMQIPNLPSGYDLFLKYMDKAFNDLTGSYDVDQGRAPGSMTAASGLMLLDERAQTMVRDEIRAMEEIINFIGSAWLSHAQNWYTEDRLFAVKDENGQMKRIRISGRDLIGEYEFRVVAGSTLPVSRINRHEQALTLFKAQAIDVDDLLEKLEWDGRREIARRRAQAQQGQMQAQQQAQQTEWQLRLMELKIKEREVAVKEYLAHIRRGEAIAGAQHDRLQLEAQDVQHLEKLKAQRETEALQMLPQPEAGNA